MDCSILQLIQFFLLGVYGVVVYIFNTGYPPLAFWLATSQPAIFFGLFADFYIKSYKKAKKVQ